MSTGLKREIGTGFWVGNGSTDNFSTALSIPWSSDKFALALIFVSFAYSG